MVGVVSGIVLLLHKSLTQCVRQDGGKDHVVGIGYNDGTGFSALGGVHEAAFRAGILTQAAHGGRRRVDDAHDAGCDHEVAEPEVDDPFFRHGYSRF